MVRALLWGAETPEVTAAESPVPGPSLETLLAGFERWTPEGF
jgi:hypothetical protein